MGSLMVLAVRTLSSPARLKVMPLFRLQAAIQTLPGKFFISFSISSLKSTSDCIWAVWTKISKMEAMANMVKPFTEKALQNRQQSWMGGKTF
jgi:hypothetical protein